MSGRTKPRVLSLGTMKEGKGRVLMILHTLETIDEGGGGHVCLFRLRQTAYAEFCNDEAGGGKGGRGGG